MSARFWYRRLRAWAELLNADSDNALHEFGRRMQDFCRFIQSAYLNRSTHSGLARLKSLE